MALVVQVRSSVKCTPKEFSAANSLHSRAVDGQWGVVNGVPLPEVQHNLLCLPHIEGKIVSATPFSQLCHFLSVVRFIIVADETHHCCVGAALSLGRANNAARFTRVITLL